MASPIVKTLHVPLDPAGRAVVRPDLSLIGDPWLFVIADAAHCPTPEGRPLPGLAAVDMQQGHYVATIISRQIPESDRTPFDYKDRGILATIGRAKAVARLGPVSLSGGVAGLVFHPCIFSDRISKPDPRDVGMDVVLPYLQTGSSINLLEDRQKSGE